MCSKVLKAKYCPNFSLWDAKYRKGDSWFWKGFAEGINFIDNNVGWIIGNGDKIYVWITKKDLGGLVLI